MEQYLTFIKKEWGVVSGAPLTFVTLALFMGGCVYAVMKWYYSGQIETLKGRISLKDDQLSSYREKLSGASPEEAKAKIDRLQADLDALKPEIGALKPRQLGGQKREKIVATARARPRGLLVVAHDLSCADAVGYKEELVAAFKAAGWRVVKSSFMGAALTTKCGLSLLVDDPTNLTPLETAVMDVLNIAQIEFEIAEGTAPEESDAGLWVTARLP